LRDRLGQARKRLGVREVEGAAQHVGLRPGAQNA
jgi:hypothetical protein